MTQPELPDHCVKDDATLSAMAALMPAMPEDREDAHLGADALPFEQREQVPFSSDEPDDDESEV